MCYMWELSIDIRFNIERICVSKWNADKIKYLLIDN